MNPKTSAHRVQTIAFFILIGILVVAFLLSLRLGSVNIPTDQILRVLTGGQPDKPAWADVIVKFRLPKAITAVLVGAALSVGGLVMQTLFRNPLADPFILGVSSGASLGVALVIMGSTSGAALGFIAGLSAFGDLSLALAASLGAGLVLAIVLALSRKVNGTLTLLIIGLMFGYLANAVVSLLIYFSQPERVQAFSLWAAGSFAGVTWTQMGVFIPTIGIGLAIALLMIKPLNALLLGDDYAASMGLRVRRARFALLLAASLLAGVSTAFCGPIWFVGVAVPHLTRTIFNTADHRVLVPASLLFGASFALIADIAAQLPGLQTTLPLNVVMSLFGVPVIFWIILRQRQLSGAFAK